MTYRELHYPEAYPSMGDDLQRLHPWESLGNLEIFWLVGETPLPRNCYCLFNLGSGPWESFRRFLRLVSFLYFLHFAYQVSWGG